MSLTPPLSTEIRTARGGAPIRLFLNPDARPDAETMAQLEVEREAAAASRPRAAAVR